MQQTVSLKEAQDLIATVGKEVTIEGWLHKKRLLKPASRSL